MRGSGKMATTIFFLAACVALIAAAFMYASNGERDTEKAGEMARNALDVAEKAAKDVSSLIMDFSQTKEKIKDLEDNYDTLLDNHKTSVNNLSERLVHLEQRPLAKQRVILSQEKPLSVHLIYRESKPRAAAPPTQLLKKVKKQMEGLSK